MHFQRTKKGFTLIELLVVIAILAVLVTVSVIGYTSFIERAKISKDTLTLSQYNTILEVCAAYEGHNRTMTEALADLTENGVEDVLLKASAKDCDIVWDSTTDRFLLIKKGRVLYPEHEEEILPSSCFLAVHGGDEFAGPYSVYLAEGFSDSEIVLHNVGFDDGGKGLSASLLGDTAESVVLNTAGGSASVNLPNGTVHHYGNAEQVTVQAIADASYHVYGQIELLILHRGHVVLEKGAVVKQLIVHGGTVLCKEGAVAEYIDNRGGSVTVPPTDSPSLFAGGDGSEENPFLIATPQQFANIASLMEGNYWESGERITLQEAVSTTVPALERGLSYFYQNSALKSEEYMKTGIEHTLDELPEEVQAALLAECEKAGVPMGTVDTLGLKYRTLVGGKIDSVTYYRLQDKEVDETITYGKIDYHFRLTADIALPNDYEPIPVFFGILDGAGHTLSAPADNNRREQACVIFEEALAGSAFKDFTFCLAQKPYSLVGGESRQTNGELTFERITVTGQEEGSWVSVSQDGFGALARCAMHSWNAQLTVKNCVNLANFDFHGSASAVFVGERCLALYSDNRDTYDNSTVTFTDCDNLGELKNSEFAFWGIGAPSQGANLAELDWLKVENCDEQTKK